ncbi:MAG TPA: helix-turn-helix domain-containing protein [Candidatus Eremiobacteraceae bacterium]
MSKTEKHFVENKPQLAALASGVRQEIVDVLPRLGTVSVAELAAALGRPPDALYYHVRALLRVGLIVRTGFAQKGRRQESAYRAVAPQLELRLDPRSPAREKAASAIVSSMMRMGIRDYGRSIRRADVVASGPDRDLWALRTTGWLTPANVAKVARSIQRLLTSVSQPKGPGQLYGLTLVFAPLHQRGRERKRRP